MAPVVAGSNPVTHPIKKKMANPLKPIKGRPMDRKSARFSTRLPIQYYVKGVVLDIGFKDAVTTDLSSTGLSFENNKPIREGSIIEIKIFMPGYKKPIQVTGKVIRTDRYTNMFVVAVAFEKINPVDKEKINFWYYKDTLKL